MKFKLTMGDPMKRTTLRSLLLRALIVVTVLTVVFAFAYKEFLRHTITNQCSEETGRKISMLQKDINELEAKDGQKNILKTVSAELAVYSSFDINFDQPFGDSLHFMSQRSPNCHYCAVLLDEDNNIVSSNRQILTANMKFGNNDSDNGIYLCDNEALQMEQVDTDLGYTWEDRNADNAVRIGVNWGYTTSQLDAGMDAGTIAAVAAFLILVIVTGSSAR